MKPKPSSTHFNDAGEVHMVDVTEKAVTARSATASAVICMSREAADAIEAGDAKKGDVLAVARLAGISASKWTQHLIPLCHAIPIEAVSIDFEWVQCEASEMDQSSRFLRCLATARTTSKTGIEMEAMTAASITALTVYDMLKSVDRAMVVRQVQLESKSGGKSGDFRRPQDGGKFGD